MSSKKKVQCQVCGRDFIRITQSHLDMCSPGLSLEEYRRVYGPTSPDGLSRTALAKSAGEIAAVVVDAINKDDALLADIATRVGNHLFSEHARGKILGAALMVLAERSGAYQGTLEKVRAIEKELFAQHRIEAGGPDGAPTDTGTLLGMAKYASGSLKDAEESLLRLVRSAIDDRKIHQTQVAIQQNFSGVHERIPVPKDLNPTQREALRRLGSRLIRAPRTVDELIAEAKRLNDDTRENEEVIDAEVIETEREAVEE